MPVPVREQRVCSCLCQWSSCQWLVVTAPLFQMSRDGESRGVGGRARSRLVPFQHFTSCIALWRHIRCSHCVAVPLQQPAWPQKGHKHCKERQNVFQSLCAPSRSKAPHCKLLCISHCRRAMRSVALPAHTELVRIPSAHTQLGQSTWQQLCEG